MSWTASESTVRLFKATETIRAANREVYFGQQHPLWGKVVPVISECHQPVSAGTACVVIKWSFIVRETTRTSVDVCKSVYFIPTAERKKRRRGRAYIQDGTGINSDFLTSLSDRTEYFSGQMFYTHLLIIIIYYSPVSQLQPSAASALQH